MDTWLIVTIALVLLIIVYIIKTQRSFIGLDEVRENALSTIGVQQQSRWDALIQLAKVIKGYTKHESETLEKVIQARSNARPSSVEDVNTNEKEFQKAMANFNVVVEQYPDLKAQPLFQQLMDSLDSYEKNVRIARQVYNDTVSKWNTMVRRIPSNFVAGIFGFKTKSYVDTPEEKKDMPDMDILL